jgi:hypothetical protein
VNYYWPITNSAENIMSGVSLDQENLVRDVLAQNNSAIRITGKVDSIIIKEDIDLNEDFTITMWARVIENRFNAALFDLGNGPKNHNIMLYFSQLTMKPAVAVYNKAIRMGVARSSREISLGVWHHYAVTIDQDRLSLYVDGVLAETVECSSIISSASRSVNYLGRSSWKNTDINADFDQIKIYNRTLHQAEINDEMLSMFTKFYQKDNDQLDFTGVFSPLRVYTMDYEASLVSYWPFSGNAKNMITGVSLKHKLDFVNDRFNHSSSAIRSSVNKGSMVMSEELTLGSRFTIMFWLKLTENRYDQSLFDFSNGESNDNVLMYMSMLKLIPVVSVYDAENQSGKMTADTSVELNKWYHYAVTMSDTQLVLYLDGEPIKSLRCSMKLNDSPKTINYIGRSSWNSGDFTTAGDFDEFKILTRSLSQAEIQNEVSNKISYIIEI